MIEEFHNIEPYSLSKKEKNQLLTRELTELTTYHREHCEQYDNILSAFELNEKNIKTVEDIPFLPVRIFKEICL